jgi:hypothetical protein
MAAQDVSLSAHLIKDRHHPTFCKFAEGLAAVTQ